MKQPNDDPVFDGDSRIDRVTWEAVLLNAAPRFAQLYRATDFEQNSAHCPDIVSEQ